ncbi:hypothetical protein [Nonomuraea sp. B5E05]|uniref:hypothetical protein n=1 Tax=Nonomuraea sp. B5E05 TaxID=3153569 RepID=UPI003261280F
MLPVKTTFWLIDLASGEGHGRDRIGDLLREGGLTPIPRVLARRALMRAVHLCRVF